MFKLFFKKINKNPLTSSPECNHAIIDIQDRLININNNIEQIKENNYKESQINWKFILTTTPLYFSLLGFFAILIGAFKIHSYLNGIGYIGVFSEIIGSPSTLIGVVVAYSLLVFTLGIYFFIPFFMFLFINYNKKVFESLEGKEWLIITLYHVFYIIISLLVIIWGSLIYSANNYDGCVFYVGLSLCLILPFAIFIFFKSSIDFFYLALLSTVCFFYSYSYPILYIKTILSFESRFDWQRAIFFALPILNIVIISFSLWIFRQQTKKTHVHKDDSIFMAIICTFLLGLFIIFLSFFTRFADLSLYVPRFIEKPQDASWYLIHNGNTASDTINGMSKTHIKSYRNIFKPYSWQGYCQEDVFTQTNMSTCSLIFDWAENALYGYMAWNLGNTKVFCPVSVDFFDDADNTEKSKKCLVIDGKYLQPISTYHLSR